VGVGTACGAVVTKDLESMLMASREDSHLHSLHVPRFLYYATRAKPNDWSAPGAVELTRGGTVDDGQAGEHHSGEGPGAAPHDEPGPGRG
jgi:hypothetical protein